MSEKQIGDLCLVIIFVLLAFGWSPGDEITKGNTKPTVKKRATHSWQEVNAQRQEILQILNETEDMLNRGELL